MKLASLVLLLVLTVSSFAQGRIEIVATIDWTDQVVIRQEGASWQHLFGNLAETQMEINGVLWRPSQDATLENSGPTQFLTNEVNFLAARLEILEGRDTVVLQRERDHLVLSFADTLSGPGAYRLVITFPPAPTLLVEATIDGSDELHISNAGARWLHKHWSFPTDVRVNSVNWNPAASPFLANDGASIFLPEPVNFENAAVLEQSGRDFVTVRPVTDGLVINFADGFLGSGQYSALISFPPTEPLPAALIPAVTSAEMQLVDAAAISVSTIRGAWYELQSTEDVGANNWVSTGAYIVGNGGVMTMFDPVGSVGTRFYRVAVRNRP